LEIQVNPDGGFINERKNCIIHKRYCQVHSELRKFMEEFIPIHKENFFDHSSAARTLLGLIQNFNNQAKYNTGRAIANMNLTSKNLNVILGCQD
jgi:hypothetical protein